MCRDGNESVGSCLLSFLPLSALPVWYLYFLLLFCLACSLITFAMLFPQTLVFVFCGVCPEQEEELRNSGDPKYEHLKESLFVLVEARGSKAIATARLAAGIAEVRKMLIPCVSGPSAHAWCSVVVHRQYLIEGCLSCLGTSLFYRPLSNSRCQPERRGGLWPWGTPKISNHLPLVLWRIIQ